MLKIRQLCLSCVYFLLSSSRDPHETQYLLEIQQSCVLVCKKGQILQDLVGNLLAHGDSFVVAKTLKEALARVEACLLLLLDVEGIDFDVKLAPSVEKINDCDAVCGASNVGILFFVILASTGKWWHTAMSDKDGLSEETKNLPDPHADRGAVAYGDVGQGRAVRRNKKSSPRPPVEMSRNGVVSAGRAG